MHIQNFRQNLVSFHTPVHSAQPWRNVRYKMYISL